MSADSTSNPLENLLPTGREPPRRIGARIEHLSQLRESSSARSKELDRFFLESYMALLEQFDQLKHRLRDVSNIQTELREVLRKITAPPWFCGVFLRAVEMPEGPLAEVFHNGGRRLVHLSQDVDFSDLSPGQVVYLGHELNAVLGAGPKGSPEAGDTATVERVLADGRIALRDRDAEVIVNGTPSLSAHGVSAGDSVRWSRDLMLALEPVRASAPTELFVTEYLSADTAPPLGGLAVEMQRVVSLFTQTIVAPEMAERYGLTRGASLLLHGPPGNGKTSLARIIGAALASVTGQRCRFASVKGAQLERPFVGETQRNVHALFAELMRDDVPALIFIDEVDAIGRTRGGISGHHSDKFLSAWLTEIDGLERGRPIGIIGATNRKDLIDQALLERLSGMELFIDRPSIDTAREIFTVHLPPSLPYGPNGAQSATTREQIVETAVGTLYSPNANNTIAELRLRDGSARTVSAREILSGRSIEQICVHARRIAFTRHSCGGAAGVRVEDIEDAVAQALERMASALSPVNARALLGDLPQDVDVVAVEPVRRKISPHRYLHRAARS